MEFIEKLIKYNFVVFHTRTVDFPGFSLKQSLYKGEAGEDHVITSRTISARQRAQYSLKWLQLVYFIWVLSLFRPSI